MSTIVRKIWKLFREEHSSETERDMASHIFMDQGIDSAGQNSKHVSPSRSASTDQKVQIYDPIFNSEQLIEVSL